MYESLQIILSHFFTENQSCEKDVGIFMRHYVTLHQTLQTCCHCDDHN